MNPNQWIPSFRQTILDFLSGVVSIEEHRVWQANPERNGYMLELMQWLIEDFAFTTDSKCSIDSYLYDESELESVATFSRLVEQVGDRIGWHVADATWLLQPEWSDIEGLANDALQVMHENDAHGVHKTI